MAGNPICRQIDWDENEAHLAAWKEGRTGFPWIDAIMTQVWGAGLVSCIFVVCGKRQFLYLSVLLLTPVMILCIFTKLYL